MMRVINMITCSWDQWPSPGNRIPFCRYNGIQDRFHQGIRIPIRRKGLPVYPDVNCMCLSVLGYREAPVLAKYLLCRPKQA